MMTLYIVTGVVLTIVFILSITLLYTVYVDATQAVTTHRVQDYQVVEIKRLLSDKECDDIIMYAKQKGLVDSMVWESENTYTETHRKSKQCWVSDGECTTASKVSKISERLTGIPIGNQELLQVAMYEPGGKFNEHYDACDYNSQINCDKMNNGAGQRLATLLIYINDDYTGGETEFTEIGVSIKPEKGKGILFWNTTNNEEIIKQSKHMGREVRSGQKWICTKWCHAKPYSK